MAVSTFLSMDKRKIPLNSASYQVLLHFTQYSGERNARKGPFDLLHCPLFFARSQVVEKARADAEKIKLIGAAEATAIENVGRAEAEAMRLKASAYKQYGDAAVLALVLEALPKVLALSSLSCSLLLFLLLRLHVLILLETDRRRGSRAARQNGRNRPAQRIEQHDFRDQQNGQPSPSSRSRPHRSGLVRGERNTFALSRREHRLIVAFLVAGSPQNSGRKVKRPSVQRRNGSRINGTSFHS